MKPIEKKLEDLYSCLCNIKDGIAVNTETINTIIENSTNEEQVVVTIPEDPAVAIVPVFPGQYPGPAGVPLTNVPDNPTFPNVINTISEEVVHIQEEVGNLTEHQIVLPKGNLLQPAAQQFALPVNPGDPDTVIVKGVDDAVDFLTEAVLTLTENYNELIQTNLELTNLINHTTSFLMTSENCLGQINYSPQYGFVNSQNQTVTLGQLLVQSCECCQECDCDTKPTGFTMDIPSDC